MEGMTKQGDKLLISLKCNLWYYMTSIRISSIILLFFSLLIVTYVISITTLIRRNIPITKVPHGIWYSIGKLFRIDRFITKGSAIPRLIPEREAFRMHRRLSK